MKIFLQCCMMLFAFICGSNSDDVKIRCSQLQFFTNSFLDVMASNSATGQDVTMMDEIMTTSRDQCLEACCDQISDGCTVAVFSEMDEECYLYQCSPVDSCVVSSSANNTTIFIGQVSTTSTKSGSTTDSTQISSTVPLSQTTEAAKLETIDQSARTTSTPVKVIQYLGNTMPSSTDSQETITTKKNDLEEAVQKTKSTVGHDTTDVNQMKESLNNIPNDLSSTPMQQELKKTAAADDKSSEKSSLPSTTVEHETTPHNPKQTTSTKGLATLATLSKEITPESQVPPPTSSTQNGLTTESATSTFSAGSTAVSKNEEGDRTTEAVQTTESTSITMNVNESITEKVSTDNIIKTDVNSAETTTTESNTPTSHTTSSYVTHTSTPLTTYKGTTPGEEEEHTAVTTSNSQKIQASSVTLTNQTDHVSFTENIQLQSVTISITNTTSTMSTSTDELIKELHQLNNTITTQSNTSEQVVINKQGADQIRINNTLPNIDFSEDLVVSGALIAALSFGILFFVAMMVLVGRRCFEGWKRRHYSRIDYLVNGMYN